MKDFKSININRIIDYISDGIKTDVCKNIGLECEHIITDKNNNSVSFYGFNGIELILSDLAVFYPIKTYSDGYLVGLNDGEVFITLEPAAQIEVSIIPLDNILKIRNLYQTFTDRIGLILDKFGYKLLNVGYHPCAKSDELDLIPKERYRLMDKFFLNKGFNPRYMMRGSASVQINIDYFSEKDFCEKLRLANILTPLFYLITDNSLLFEGSEYEGFSARSFAWENVDDSRCGCFDFNSFEDYARWLYSVEPIFIRKNSEDIYTGRLSNEDIFCNDELTDDDIGHIMSMVFPNVRVKRFIEIRAADSMPENLMFAYSALIKGLFYNPEAVSRLNYLFEFVNTSDMTEQIKLIQKFGFNCKYFGFDLNMIIKDVFNSATEALSPEETEILQPLKQLAFENKAPKHCHMSEVTIL